MNFITILSREDYVKFCKVIDIYHAQGYKGKFKFSSGGLNSDHMVLFGTDDVNERILFNIYCQVTDNEETYLEDEIFKPINFISEDEFKV